jgi:NAD(P)-dependent dehydrogenase (short-subunit alcohol dehydrogenase family)
MKAFELNNKRALVTGGGSGLGYSIAQKFKEAGANVLILGRNEEKIKKAAFELEVDYVVFDVIKLKEIPSLISDIESKHGTIDILVNCAGRHLKKAALDTTDEEFFDILQIHLMSVFAFVREVGKGMVERKDGSIILISSMSAIMGLGKVVAYSSGKSAILGMMKNMVAELAPHSIRINAIAPGWIETPMLHQVIDNDPERKGKILNRIPVKTFGEPDDIGYACVYLSSEAGKYVNGVLLPVDGGAAIGF